MNQLCGILRIACTQETQISDEGLNVRVGGRVHRIHLLEAILPGGFDEVAHQRGTKSAMLPGIGQQIPSPFR